MYPLGILPFAPSVSGSADSEKSSKNFELGIDFEDPTGIANCSDYVAAQSELILTKVPNTSGHQPRVDSDETAVLLSECNRLTEAVAPVECLSVLAEILADYEEPDDAPAAPSPGPFESPHIMIAATSEESPLDEQSSPREHKPRSSFLSSSDRSTSVEPQNSPLLSHLPSIALEIENFGLFSSSNLTTLRSPRTTVAIPSEKPLQDLWSLLLSLRPSPDCSTSMDPWKPILSLSSVVHSPLVISLPLSTSPVSLSTPLASPASPTGPDIELLDRYPAVATAPESGDETPTGACTAASPFKEGHFPDENLDELDSSRSMTVPGINLAKYSTPANEPLTYGPPVLATCCSQDSMIPIVTPEVLSGMGTSLIPYFRDPCCCLGPSLALSCSNTARRPSLDAASRTPLISWSLSSLNDRTLPSPPSTTLPLSRLYQLASGVIDTLFPSPIVIDGPYLLPWICDIGASLPIAPYR